MSEPYALVPDLTQLVGELQPESIISRTFYQGVRMRGIVFGFDAGQELSEHTSSQNAVIQILRGEARVTLGDEAHELAAGAWIQMTPHLRHSVYARTPMIMLLLMLGAE